MATEQQREAIAAIEKHRADVRDLLLEMCSQLAKRAEDHDRSKLEDTELPIFASVPRPTDAVDFGSDEYLRRLEERLQPALEHHYAVNRHHPEHFADQGGIRAMNLLDVLEMVADWKIASAENGEQDFAAAINKAQDRFGFGDELKSIFQHTAELFDSAPPFDRNQSTER